MSVPFIARRANLWPIALAVVVAASIWGLYAWRHAGPSPAADPPLADAGEQAAVPGDGAAAGQAEQRTGRLIPLRATSPADAPALRAAHPASPPGAWANRPMSIGDGVVDDVEADGGDVERDVERHIERDDNRGDVDRRGYNEPAAAPSPGAAALQSALAAVGRGDLLGARNMLTGALRFGLDFDDARAARAELARIADALLFSRAANVDDPLVGAHVVEPGDTLAALAAKHRISEDTIARINGISQPDLIQVGQRLKMLNGPFRIVIDKSDFRMDVMLGDVLVRSLPVGLGVDGSTPTGKWVVRDKLRNPDWTDPVTNRHYSAGDPDNPIGDRWIALEGVEGEAVGKRGFGIHGTVDAGSIGQEMSMGCVRLAAPDIALLFDLVVVRQTTVEIRP